MYVHACVRAGIIPPACAACSSHLQRRKTKVLIVEIAVSCALARLNLGPKFLGMMLSLWKSSDAKYASKMDSTMTRARPAQTRRSGAVEGK